MLRWPLYCYTDVIKGRLCLKAFINLVLKKTSLEPGALVNMCHPATPLKFWLQVNCQHHHPSRKGTAQCRLSCAITRSVSSKVKYNIKIYKTETALSSLPHFAGDTRAERSSLSPAHPAREENTLQSCIIRTCRTHLPYHDSWRSQWRLRLITYGF